MTRPTSESFQTLCWTARKTSPISGRLAAHFTWARSAEVHGADQHVDVTAFATENCTTLTNAAGDVAVTQDRLKTAL